MRTWKSKAAIGLVLLMVATACSGTAEETTSTSETGAETSVTTTAAPEPTDPEPPPAPVVTGEYPVIMTEGLSGPDIENITVWAPDAEDEFPVVLLLPGWSEKAAHYRLIAERLAGEGVVVFAPDYRARDIDTDVRNPYRDAECAHRHMRTLAGDFNGDLTRPVTVVGHSLGGIVGLGLVLNEFEFGPAGSFDRCPAAEQVPRPDRLVTLSSCYFESLIDGTRFPFDPAAYGWTHFDAVIQLVVGSDDEVCAPWQPQDAMEALADDGFENVELTVIDGADHFDVMFTRWEGDGEWWEASEWFDVPNNPGGVAAVEAMLDTIMEPGFGSPDYYEALARQYCEAWPDVATFLADDATYAEVPSDGLSIPEGTSFRRGPSDDLISGSAAVLASLSSTEHPQVECSEAVTVSGDWVAIPYTAVGAEAESPHQGIWVLRIHGGGIQWHLAYRTDVADGEEFASFNDPVVAAEARDFCSILEGSGKVRSASEMMAAMTDEPAVINLPEGLYWSGAAEVEALVPLYPPELEIQCGDNVVASGDWSAHPIVENAPSIGLEQVGMWVYNHRDGKIHRHFAHNTRTAGSGWGLPLGG